MRCSICLSLLWGLGCVPIVDEPAAPQVSAAGQLAPPGALDLFSTPLWLGRTASFTVSGALPGATVSVYGSASSTGQTCLASLGGDCVDLPGAFALASGTADANGEVVLQRALPAAIPLQSAFLQAAVHVGGTTRTSEVLEVRFVDANNTDTDGDGLVDAFELDSGLDPLDPDPDGDFLSDGEELAAGTDPFDPDTDGDTLLDGVEVYYGTDPLSSDTDGDGADDGLEVALGLDPRVPDILTGLGDSDGDGIPDGFDIEECDGLDNDGDGLVDEGTLDSDGDGICDRVDIEVCNCSDDDGDGLVDEDCVYELAVHVAADQFHSVWLDGVTAGAGEHLTSPALYTTTVNGGIHHVAIEVGEGVAPLGGLRAAVSVDGGRVSVTGDGSWSVNEVVPEETWQTTVQPGSTSAGDPVLTGPPLLDSFDASWVWTPSAVGNNAYVLELLVCGAPTAFEEVCDGLDNDGNGLVDEIFVDADGNGTADCAEPEATCDGLDDDGDGQIDEGFSDSDYDGTADCLEIEVCDGFDNDGDDSVDEGFGDVDGDGIADCVDAETCDGLDNDGDGEIDEDFPDTDGDGIADCLDVEVCDGLDNDGDNAIDEGMPDTDGDGLCDALDTETCDGVDNDGDGEIDEDQLDVDGDGLCDAIDLELCNGIDDDGDGDVDEGFDADFDGLADCFDTEECDCLDNDGDGVTDNGCDYEIGVVAAALGTVEIRVDGASQGSGSWEDSPIVTRAVVSAGEHTITAVVSRDGRPRQGFLATAYVNGVPSFSTGEDGWLLAADPADPAGPTAGPPLLLDPNETPAAPSSLAAVSAGWVWSGSEDDRVAFQLQLDVCGPLLTLPIELCDGLDNNGNDLVDEGLADLDGDGVADCVDPEDLCNGIDDDLDGAVDEGFPDSDLDGVADCVSTEACDGLDNDGDGLIDEGFIDTDGDGVADCVEIEVCDGVDNNGDGVIDEGFAADLDADGVPDCLEPICAVEDPRLWAVVATGDQSELRVFDIMAGTEVVVGVLDQPLLDLSFHPDGRLIGLGSVGDLYSVDAATGSTQLIGYAMEAGRPVSASGLTLDAEGTAWLAGGYVIYAVDLITLVAVPAVHLPLGSVSTPGDLASFQGDLYYSGRLASGAGWSLNRVDVAAATTTAVAPGAQRGLGVAAGRLWAGADDTLFVADVVAGSMMPVQALAGAGSITGLTGASDWCGGTPETCNGIDDDGDGLIDEGFDSDGDDLPDCFDEEVCDRVDNDGDGLIDEGFDSDWDSISDCFDIEECDGLDNDGDGFVDETFPDLDGDGSADCENFPSPVPEAIISVNCLSLDCLDVLYSATESIGENLTFTWQFEDGVEATGATVTRSYPVPGTHTATVEALAAVGQSHVAIAVVGPPTFLVIGPDPNFQFKLSQAVWLFQQGTCAYRTSVIDYPSQGSFGVAGCFTASDTVDLFTQHLQPGGTSGNQQLPDTLLWTDEIRYTPAGGGQAASISITDKNPDLDFGMNGLPTDPTRFKSWYMTFNPGGNANDFAHPTMLQNGNSIPGALANQPPVYDDVDFLGRTPWPPAHLTAWHLLPPGLKARSTWTVQRPGFPVDYHSDVITVTCPSDMSPLQRPVVVVGSTDTASEPIDFDGDGFVAGDDCYDHDPNSYPGAPEDNTDGYDNNCDGFAEGDQDSDGYMSVGFGGGDCDDFNVNVNPGRTEVPGDGIDQDCDPSNDQDFTVLDTGDTGGSIGTPGDTTCDCLDDDGDGEIDEDCAYEFIFDVQAPAGIVYVDGQAVDIVTAFGATSVAGGIGGGVHFFAVEAAALPGQPAGARAIVRISNGDTAAMPGQGWTATDATPPASWALAPLEQDVLPAVCTYATAASELDALGVGWAWLGTCAAPSPTPQNWFVLELLVCGPQ